MKKIYLFLIIAITSTSLFGQAGVQDIFYIDTYDGKTVTSGVTQANGDVLDCNGIDYFTSTDLCGGFSQYCNNEDYTVTFCAATPGDLLKFTFYMFDSEATFDYLQVYDGPSTASTLVATYTGTYSEPNLPFFIRSTGSCLTFKWHSDGSTRGDGWDAVIDCASPAPTGCNGNDVAADYCSDAPQICNLNGYCGTTDAWYTPDNVQLESTTSGGNNVFCGSIENNSWISFIASGTSASFDVAVSMCDALGNGGANTTSGIQVAILSNASGDCYNFSQMYCSALDGSLTSTAVTTQISATGLTVGVEYYIMIDGFGGHICDYEITANTGVEIVSIESSAGSNLCPGQTSTLSVNANLATGYSWASVPAGASGTTSAINSGSIVVPTTYYVTVNGICGGYEVTSITLNPLNPTVDFHAEINTSPYSTISPFPSTVGCQDSWFYLSANDSSVSNGYISPALHFIFNSDANAVSNGTYVNIYSGNPSAGGTQIYTSSLQNNYELTVYGDHLKPNQDYYIQLCENSPGNGGVDWEVRDGVSNGLIGSGSMIDGNPCETYGPFKISDVNPTLSATWTVSPDPGAGVAWNDIGNGEMWFDPTAMSPGNYTVTYNWNSGVGCSGTQSKVITVGPGPSANISSAASVLNCTLTSTTLSALGSTDAAGATSPPSGMDSYAWGTTGGSFSGGTTSSTAVATGPGVYFVTVTDNGCTDVASFTVTQNIATPTAVITTTASVLTCITTSAIIDASGSSDGSGVKDGSIIYTWAASGGGNIVSNTGTGQITVDAAGTYTVTVTDQTNGCTDVTSQVITQNITPPTADAGGPYSQIACNNTSEVLTATGGGTYIWSASGGGNIVSGGSTASPTINAAGTYTVTVTSAVNGCTATDAVVITSPTALSLTAVNNQNVSCNGGNNGSVTATGAGGGGGYTYAWNPGGLTGGSQNSLTAGVYTITVTDANTCTQTATVTITQPATVVALSVSSTTNVSCNGGNDGQATVAASGGTIGTGYTYSWPGGQTSATGTGLSVAGSPYTVTATDGNGCTATTVVNVTQPTVLSITVTGTNVNCNGGNNGTSSVSVGGGTPTYTYLWSNGATTANINTLIVGVYTVTVTDNKSCTQSGSYTVIQPSALSVTMAGNNPNCNGTNDGDATATVAGGTAPYTYIWDDPSFQTNPTATGLVAGTYSVTVTDNRSCTITDSQLLTEPTALTLTMGSNDASCGNPDGDASVTVTGGTGPYTYAWSNGGNTPTINSLSAATYTVTVTDNLTCTESNSVAVNNSSAPTITITSVTTITCNGGTNGSITAEVSGGTAPYTWSWSNGDAAAGVTTHTITGLSSNTYGLTITDSQGTPCIASESVLVSQPTALNASIISTNNPDCNGGTDGSSTVGTSGGTPTYTYLWSNGATNNSATGLNAGTYTVTVTDNNTCTRTVSATLTEPTILAVSSTVTDATCNGSSDGSINIDVTGGTTSYSYNWSNGAASQDISSLATGNYTVTITDAASCVTITSISVGEPTALSVIMTTCQNVATSGGSEGSSGVTVSGGTTNYTYQWSNGVTATGVTSSTITGLPTGTYIVTVTDANSCQGTASCVVNDVLCNVSVSTTVTDLLCNGDADGEIDAILSGSAGTTFTYSWSASVGGQTTSTVTGLAGGNHFVTITDDLACSAVATISVVEPSALTINTTVTDILCNGDADGSINVQVNGGVPNYTYNWNIPQTTANITGLSGGLHRLTVTDNNLCSITVSGMVNEPSAISVSSSVSDALCVGANSGAINLIVTGGTPVYNYTWSSGNTTEDISSLSANTYTVTVIDNNTCFEVASYTLSEPAMSLTATFTVTDITCAGNDDGIVALTPSGGTPAYSFTWVDGQTTQIATGLQQGFNTVTITDNNNCTYTQNYNIAEPTALSISTTCNDVSVSGASDGGSTASVSGGITPYVYNWSAGSSTTNSVTGLTSGVIGLTITDANNCIATSSCVVNDPGCSISISTTITDVLCNGGSTGSILAEATGGLAPYQFVWSEGSSVGNISNLLSGNYSVTITDAAMCVLIDNSSVVSEPATALNVAMVSCTDPSFTGASDGYSEINVTGGTGGTGYTYVWSTGASTISITGLGGGAYGITVTDGNGCIASNVCNLTDPGCSVTYNVTTTQTSCGGTSDALATVYPAGGLTPYTFMWSDGETTQTATGLSTSDNVVNITDAAGCLASALYTITEPTAVQLTVSTTDASCNGATNGSAEVFATGGNSGYTYSWSDGQVTSLATGLTVGSYDVTVYDVNMCNSTISASVGQPAQTLAVTVTDVNGENCGNADGAVTITGTGGTPGYTYNWSTGSVANMLSNLIAGVYAVTVTDINNCTVSDNVTVPSNGGIASVGITATDVSCYGGSDGSIIAVPIGGTSPYTFMWSTGTTASGASSLISGLVAGNYTNLITDANGCPYTSGGFIGQPTQLQLSSSINEAGCSGSTDGAVSVTASGGTMPYSYLWFDGATTNSQSGLSAGTYSVTATDDNACQVVNDITVTEPFGMQAIINATDVTCKDGSDGSVEVIHIGGTPNYSYNWSNGATTKIITGLENGAYICTVTDQNGCDVVASTLVDEPLQNFIFASTITEALCNGGSEGVIELKAAGGTAPYTFTWPDGTTSTTATGLTSGRYIITISDASGCSEIADLYLNQPDNLFIYHEETDALCGQSNGQSVALASGGTTPYVYNWYGNQNATGPVVGVGPTISGLDAGIYTVVAYDDNSCKDTAYILIENPEPELVIDNSNNISCFSGTDGLISGVGSQGQSPYTFTWIPSLPPSLTTTGIDNASATGLDAGVYFLSMTDANGCIQLEYVELTQPDSLMVGFSNFSPVSCNGSSDAVIKVDVTGGTFPYTFAWDNALTTQVTSGLAAGSYNVTVEDKNGCLNYVTVTIDEPAILSLIGSSQTVDCSGAMNGVASVSVTGGTSPFSYQWDASANNSTSNPVSGLAGGTYAVTVTDDHSCIENTVVTVTEIPALSVTPSIVEEICDGLDASITLNVSGGTTDYSYQWSSPVSSNTTSSVTGIAQGNYSVTVLDANNCSVTESITVGGTSIPATPVAGQDQEVCFGANIQTLGALPPNPSISWYDDAAMTNLVGNGAIHKSDTTVGTHTYYVTETQDGCESAPALVTVIVKPLPSPASVGDDTIVCYGDSINMFMDNQGGQVYWYRDALGANLIDSGEVFTDDIIKWDTTLTYYYQVVIDGCTSTLDSFNILFGDSTIASFTATPEIGTVDLDVEFANTSVGVDENFDLIYWEFGTGDESSEYEPSYTYTEGGTYEVTLIVEDYITGCIDTANTVTIVTDEAASFDIPIVFSPNGDGENDVFKVNGNNLTKVDGKIYNRWGELIFEWVLPEEAWDGRTFSGEEAPEGTYFFVISGEGLDKDGNTVVFGTDGPVTGTLTLVR